MTLTDEQAESYKRMRRACNALRLEVHQSIADDVIKHFEDYVTAAKASETRLREGLRELVEKLELLDKSEELKSIFVFAHVHGMVYAGPNWEKELKAGRALLSLEGDKTAGVAASPEAKQ